jgi:hypothetical protein
MKIDNGKLAGILGTVILHLIAGIIFISLQIKALNRVYHEEMIVELNTATEEEINEKNEKQEKPAVATVESILKDDPEMLNIARNLANKSEEKINAADYIDKVKEELIKSGKLGTDNYIDEKKKGSTGKGEVAVASESDKAKKESKSQSDESQKMAANYKGPTRIYYELSGRNHLYLPLPIYMCQGSGKVTLTIEVNQLGEVTKAEISTGESTATDECLIETAEKTALNSKFNPDYKSPKIQTGTLTYIFVAQ